MIPFKCPNSVRTLVSCSRSRAPKLGRGPRQPRPRSSSSLLPGCFFASLKSCVSSSSRQRVARLEPPLSFGQRPRADAAALRVSHRLLRTLRETPRVRRSRFDLMRVGSESPLAVSTVRSVFSSTASRRAMVSAVFCPSSCIAAIVVWAAAAAPSRVARACSSRILLRSTTCWSRAAFEMPACSRIPSICCARHSRHPVDRSPKSLYASEANKPLGKAARQGP